MYIVLIMGLIIHQIYYKTREELVFTKNIARRIGRELKSWIIEC